MPTKQWEKELEKVYKNDILSRCEECKRELNKKYWRILLTSGNFTVRLDAFVEGLPHGNDVSQAHVWFFTFPDEETHEDVINIQKEDTKGYKVLGSIALQRLLDDKEDGLKLVESYLNDFREDLLKT